ncbi:MAG: hypothetical protein ACJAQT_005133 [Akkermansiaceae bacterium]|jgi:hypothetical protein
MTVWKKGLSSISGMTPGERIGGFANRLIRIKDCEGTLLHVLELLILGCPEKGRDGTSSTKSHHNQNDNRCV